MPGQVPQAKPCRVAGHLFMAGPQLRTMPMLGPQVAPEELSMAYRQKAPLTFLCQSLAAIVCVAFAALAGTGTQAQEGPPVQPVAARSQASAEVVASGLNHPWGLAFLPDGKKLVSVHDPGGKATVRLWSMAKKEPLATWAPRGVVQTVAVSPDGKWIAVGDPSGGIRIEELGAVLKKS